jgi:flavin-dependent dehydrogenase
VKELQRVGEGWRIRTGQGDLEADYCVVATGARNPLREVGTRFVPTDCMLAVGYWTPSSQAHIDIQFLPGLEGYIWVFPRCGHVSAGICGKGETAQSLRARLEAYLLEKGIGVRDGKFYSHLLPALERPSWRTNRVSGDRWMAVGDAAGLVDPITGEGLYYAMRSGDLAAETLLADKAPAQSAEEYASALRSDFTADLEFGSGLAKAIYAGRYLFGDVPTRMVQFMRRSPRFLALMQDLFAGTQPYLTLKRRLLRNMAATHYEIARRWLAEWLSPESGVPGKGEPA